MKVKSYPEIKNMNIDGGIGRVVIEYKSRLPSFNIEYVTNEKDADIIVSHAGIYDKPDVLHLHGLYWTADYHASNIEYSINASIAEAMRWAYEITVPSSWVAETIKREFRLSPHVVGHGIDCEEWSHSFKTQDYALYNKNRDGVDVCDSIHLVKLAKSLPQEPFIATFCKETLHNVFVTGVMPHDTMKYFVQNANIYLSLVKETFGIGVLEALASGVPVLGFAHGGNLDLVEHKKTGYLARVGDYEDLAEGYLWIKENREQLSPFCVESAKRFSWDSVIRKIADIYTEALRKKQEKPTYSVIIPCYNYAKYLPEAVKSALGQNVTPEKVVIVDDGSTDNTRDVALTLVNENKNVLYIRQKNAGVANARNTGIKAVNSKYVTCLDADDVLLPNFSSLLIQELEKDRSAGIAYGKIVIFKEEGAGTISDWPSEYNYQKFLEGHNQVPTMNVFRRDLWERLGGYKQRYAPQGAGAEDAEFWLRFGNLGYKGIFVNKAVAKYRLGGNTSKKEYKEPQWRDWHPFTRNIWHNFCSIAIAQTGSHPVTQYDEPIVSIVIPVGPGHEHYLYDALDSLEAQTFRKWEVIIVWDTPNKIDEYIINSYPYINFVNNSLGEKHGAGVARNIGARRARGKYLVFLDADDYLQPDFLLFTKIALEENRDVRWVYTDFSKISQGKELGYDSCEDFDITLILAKSIAPVTFLMYTEDFNVVGGFEEEHNREDWDFQLRLVKHGFYGARLPIPLFTYRIDSGFRRDYIGIAKNEDERRKLHKEDIERIHNTFKELEKMACSGCKKKIVVPQNSDELVTLVYIGDKYSTDITWRGKATGKAYRTSYGILYNVHPDDAKIFVDSGVFDYKNVPSLSQSIVTTEPKQVVVEEVLGTEKKKRAVIDNVKEKAGTISPPWWKTPENYSLTDIKRLFAERKPTALQIYEMKEAEVMGKGRKTIISYLDSKI